jgi:hypothetical protein
VISERIRASDAYAAHPGILGQSVGARRETVALSAGQHTSGLGPECADVPQGALRTCAPTTKHRSSPPTDSSEGGP